MSTARIAGGSALSLAAMLPRIGGGADAACTRCPKDPSAGAAGRRCHLSWPLTSDKAALSLRYLAPPDQAAGESGRRPAGVNWRCRNRAHRRQQSVLHSQQRQLRLQGRENPCTHQQLTG